MSFPETDESREQRTSSSERTSQEGVAFRKGVRKDLVTLHEVESLLAEGNKMFQSREVQGLVKGLVKGEATRNKAEHALRSSRGFQPLLKKSGKTKQLSESVLSVLEAGIHVLKDMEREDTETRHPPVRSPPLIG
jgi:hypothetical protein